LQAQQLIDADILVVVLRWMPLRALRPRSKSSHAVARINRTFVETWEPPFAVKRTDLLRCFDISGREFICGPQWFLLRKNALAAVGSEPMFGLAAFALRMLMVNQFLT